MDCCVCSRLVFFLNDQPGDRAGETLALPQHAGEHDATSDDASDLKRRSDDEMLNRAHYHMKKETATLRLAGETR